MITDRERRALRIAKSAYAHFTHDALQIATEILALEREINEEQDSGVTIPVFVQPEPEVKPMGEPSTSNVEHLPISREQYNARVVAGEFEEIPY
jgi:hypothetical protein